MIISVLIENIFLIYFLLLLNVRPKDAWDNSSAIHPLLNASLDIPPNLLLIEIFSRSPSPENDT